MGLRQACDFKPCTELGWRQLVGVGRIEIGMNPYPLNMKHRDGEVTVECVCSPLDEHSKIEFIPASSDKA
jgi:hypothetical protein